MKLTIEQRLYLKYFLDRIKINPEFEELSSIISNLLTDQTKDEKLLKEIMQGIDKQLENLSNTETLLGLEAITIRGYCLYQGILGKIDKNKGAEYWKIAAAKELPEAMVLFAGTLCEVGTKKDFENAFELYSRAATKGSVAGCDNVGVCYSDGKGVKADPNKAVEFFKRAVESDYFYAMFRLGLAYHKGTGVEQDPKKAFELYSRAANLGYLPAKNAVAHCYREGLGVEQNNQQCINLLFDAAKLGCWKSNGDLFTIYSEGVCGIVKDKSKAFDYLQQCISIIGQNDFPIDCNNAVYFKYLGFYYYEGAVIVKDCDKAFQCFQKAQNFEPSAQTSMGFMYLGLLKDKGKDTEQSVEYFKRAAGKGESTAKGQLIKLGCL